MIDWSRFDGTPECACTCRCVFRRLKDGDEIPTFSSHVKFVIDRGLIARKPCPDCGRVDNLHSASSVG